MQLTSLPAAEWTQVVKDAEKFWDDIAKTSARVRKVIDIIKRYNQVMEKAGYPYR
jgi:hypothetical protein